MNRNVSIVVALLVVVVIAGYLVWLRSKVQQSISPKVVEQTQVVTATPEPTIAATSSAAPEVKKEATSSTKPKISTPSSVKK